MSNLTNEMLSHSINALNESMGRLQSYEVHTKEGNIRNFSFKVKSVIGRGTFGLVSLIETNSGIQALKTVFQDNLYCNRELDILLDIEHPNIIRLTSYFYTGKTSQGHYLNLAFEYLPICLQDYIKVKTTKIETIKKLYKQAIMALNYLHLHGICHRDIKPANILLTEDLNLKICDFGSAKYIKDGTDNTSYICSRYYRAPENLLNDTKYTSKIDIWAIALVFCEFKLNEPLFHGKDSSDMLERIFDKIQLPKSMELKYKIKSKKQVNPFAFKEFLYKTFSNFDLAHILYKSLKIDPNERISASEILKLKLL